VYRARTYTEHIGHDEDEEDGLFNNTGKKQFLAKKQLVAMRRESRSYCHM
jgi:hypothetical protein